MYKWYDYYTISAWSHFYSSDLPRLFDNTDYYTNVIRNLFTNKNSNEVVKIELEYETTNNSCYMSIKVFTPRLDVKITEIVDIERFIKWYSERYEELIFRHDYKNDNIIKTTYAYNDGYTRHAIIISESLENKFDNNYIMIEFKTGGIW